MRALFILGLIVATAGVSAKKVDFLKMACLMNLERQARGIQPLALSDQLMDVAAGHSRYQSRVGAMTHDDDDGDVGERVDSSGFNWSGVAENVAEGYPDEGKVIEGWMKSPEHRANMMNPAFTHFGAARKDDYWTQVFATQKQRDQQLRQQIQSMPIGSNSASANSNGDVADQQLAVPVCPTMVDVDHMLQARYQREMASAEPHGQSASSRPSPDSNEPVAMMAMQNAQPVTTVSPRPLTSTRPRVTVAANRPENPEVPLPPQELADMVGPTEEVDLTDSPDEPVMADAGAPTADQPQSEAGASLADADPAAIDQDQSPVEADEAPGSGQTDEAPAEDSNDNQGAGNPVDRILAGVLSAVIKRRSPIYTPRRHRWSHQPQARSTVEYIDDD
ncbi:hypothetical protein H4R33_005750, partial [Dimargaris cristalligena]